MWKKIYNLIDEPDEIEITQKASKSSGKEGLSQIPALFGSEDWWKLVGTDLLPLRIIQGIVSDLYLSGHLDYPQFEVDDGSQKTQWDIYGGDSNYVLGTKVRIKYVLMEFKNNDPVLKGEKCECVISVEIET